MPSTLTPAKRFVVRTSLATGSTLALVVGAQALVTLDLQKTTVPQTSLSQVAESPTTVQTVNAPTTQAVISAAPNIVILRHASQASAAVPSGANRPSNTVRQSPQAAAAILPPQPVAVQPQPQVIVQSGGGGGSSAPVTHSSH